MPFWIDLWKLVLYVNQFTLVALYVLILFLLQVWWDTKYRWHNEHHNVILKNISAVIIPWKTKYAFMRLQMIQNITDGNVQFASYVWQWLVTLTDDR